MRPTLPAVIAALGIGYYLAPKEPLDNEVRHTGFFTVDVSRVITATVASLRAENKLVVWSYKGSATVELERTAFWLLSGSQRLIVPAVVNYQVDLSKLTLDQVTFDQAAKIVTVKLPPLELGDIAFQPENATTINGGILTYSDDQVEELRKLNYRNARRAMIKQAQGRAMIDVAKAQAKVNIASLFEVPLRRAGQPDVKVAVTF